MRKQPRLSHAFPEYFLCLKSIEKQRPGSSPCWPGLSRFGMFRLFVLGLCITLKITLRDKRLAPMIQPSTAFHAGLSVFLFQNRRE
jgi:hypothetical protein